MTRSRAADDFAAIRARMEELRRERMPAPADNDPPRPAASRTPSAGNRPASGDRPGLPPVVRRPLFR